MQALELTGVALTYRSSGRSVRALDSLAFSVEAGEPVSLIGPSGCGKSSLLLVAAGLITPDSGEVRVAGRRVSGVRRETALILQEYGLLPWKTVLDNAALGLRVRGLGAARARREALSSLELVGLADFSRSYPGELSGGMRQRLALARAVALDADLLLMDEPLSALDALTREDLQDALLDLWRRRGHAQVLVTHSIEEAVYLGRRVFVMSPRPGRIAAVVDNSDMGRPGYRSSTTFHERCVTLRALLAGEGALHPGASVAVSAEASVPRQDAGGGAR